MPGWIKKSSGKLLTSTLICPRNCRYFGFELITGGADKRFTAYNANYAQGGKEVEDFLCDGNKPTNGHGHSDPVQCSEGLYVVLAAGATAIVWYNDEIDRMNGQPFKTFR